MFATIITIVTLAAAVLNICLFFKLWGRRRAPNDAHDGTKMAIHAQGR